MTFCRLCSRDAFEAKPPRARRAPNLGCGDLPPPGQERAGERRVALEQALEVARVHDLAAVLARERADVDDVVGLEDRGLVVLDHDERVAEVAQAHERVDQALVVALVQPDRRLVEDVEHADESGADLRGEPDALRLAAREGARRPRQRQVVEPHVDEEPQPLADLLQQPLGDHELPLAQLDRLDERERCRGSNGR